MVEAINENTVEIRICDFNGFCHRSENLQISKEAYESRYINEYGSEFIKWNGNLYVMIPSLLEFSFEQVRHEEQIDKAFNPDRHRFERWMSK